MELAGAKWAWESLGATVQHALQAAQTKAATFQEAKETTSCRDK